MQRYEVAPREERSQLAIESSSQLSASCEQEGEGLEVVECEGTVIEAIVGIGEKETHNEQEHRKEKLDQKVEPGKAVAGSR